jgi:hypothetical protein
MKIQSTLVFLLAKGKIAGNNSKVKENIRYGARSRAIHLVFNGLRDRRANWPSPETNPMLLLPLYIVFLRTKMPPCVVETF